MIDDGRELLRNALESAPKLASAVATGAVGMAIAKEIGYFAVIDGRLVGYLTIQDALFDAIQTTPFVLAFACALYFLLHLERWVEKSRRRRLAAAAFFAIAAVLFAGWTYAHRNELMPSPQGTVLFFDIVTYGLVAVIIWAAVVKRNHGLVVWLVCAFALIGSAQVGAKVATRDIANEKLDYTIHTKAGTSIEADLLKAGSNYTILKNAQWEILVIPTSDIGSIERRLIEPPHD